MPLGVPKGRSPFEMRFIKYSPPPVAARPSPALTVTTGGGRGWEPEKIFPNKTGRRVQQKFNSPKILPPAPTTPPALSTKNPSPRSPEPTMSQPGLFRAKPGPIWVRTGLFWVDSGSIPGFPGSKSCCFGPPSPPGNPSPHRETCKNFTS